MLLPSILAAGLDPRALDESVTPERSTEMFGAGRGERPARWRDVWSAGHTVSAVRGITATSDLVAEIESEYVAARREFATSNQGG
jgi:nitronate monooxygenase